MSAVFGTAWFVGSAVMGILYDISIEYIIAYVVIIEIAAVAACLRVYRSRIVMRLEERIGNLMP